MAVSRHVSLIDQPCLNYKSKLCIIITSHRKKKELKPSHSVRFQNKEHLCQLHAIVIIAGSISRRRVLVIYSQRLVEASIMDGKKSNCADKVIKNIQYVSLRLSQTVRSEMTSIYVSAGIWF
jgi:hypothetical protein